MKNLIYKAEQTHSLSKDELILLLENDGCSEDLFLAADRVRQKFVGDDIHLRGLIEFSNICKNNCCYCGLRRDNSNLKRYRLSVQDILETANIGKRLGFQTLVLQSGEDLHFSLDIMTEIIKAIKSLGLSLTLSVGEKSKEEYLAYRKAGADRFLLRIETTDKKLYQELDPGMDWNVRKACLDDIKSVGMEVGSGCLVGLPGQTISSLAYDILFFKQIDADMIGIGPFIPHPDTPLKDAKVGSFFLALKVMALTRLLLPDINIPATTAMETLAPNGQIKALQAGANVIMPNITQKSVRQFYQLYPGKSETNCACENIVNELKQKFEAIGRRISQNCGTSPHFIARSLKSLENTSTSENKALEN